MRGHGFYDIGYCKDAGFQMDDVALQTMRISGTIETFMMLADELCNRPWKIDAFKDFIAVLGMQFDQGEF